MKIKAMLFSSAEVQEKMKDPKFQKLIKEEDRVMKDFGLHVNLAKVYLELDTGGYGNSLREEAREYVKKKIETTLRYFAGILLSAIALDLTIEDGTSPGGKAITEGLRKMDEMLKSFYSG